VARLDTHIAIWLYIGEDDHFSKPALEILEGETLYISPIVELEITFLHETGKIKHNGPTVVGALVERGLNISEVELNQIVSTSNILSWTRDPFDRLITADALAANDKLITRDRLIRKNYKKAVW